MSAVNCSNAERYNTILFIVPILITWTFLVVYVFGAQLSENIAATFTLIAYNVNTSTAVESAADGNASVLH